ncbi:uncharacterized protein LOC143678111 [Tamandua tetradactyla]|uniref:uncharacterized protein LOC143678111 n=1 Tax=Tamandua tetradactyla TaxID=48850 RepID=UPI004053C0FF
MRRPGAAGRAGQSGQGRMGAGSPQGAAHGPLRPVRRRRRQVSAWRSGRAPGRVLRGRPCLTRAERTKRSGPVCARGSSRGGSGGPGAWPWPSMIIWSSSFPSSVRHRSPLAAALTCAHLQLTRRRPRRPPQPLRRIPGTQQRLRRGWHWGVPSLRTGVAEKEEGWPLHPAATCRAHPAWRQSVSTRSPCGKGQPSPTWGAPHRPGRLLSRAVSGESSRQAAAWSGQAHPPSPRSPRRRCCPLCQLSPPPL